MDHTVALESQQAYKLSYYKPPSIPAPIDSGNLSTLHRHHLLIVA